MYRYGLVIFMIVYVTIVESTCPQPQQYYLDCKSSRTLINAINLCANHGMTLLNLTNSSHLIADINLLNQTLTTSNCTSSFWFSVGNKTGIVADLDSLGDVATGVLSGLVGTLGSVVNLVGNLLACLFGGCPASTTTTTAAPVTSAITICTRPVQQRVIQKCLTQSVRTDMKTYQFIEQPMYGGILDSFSSHSRTICSGLCSSDDQCIGISYINGICKLYM